MYLRKKKTPHGEVLQLIESYRNEEGKPRNRVVISLGNPEIPEENWRRIARRVEQRLYQRGKLFEPPLPPEQEAMVREWVDTIVRRIDLQGKWQPISTYMKQRSTACPVIRFPRPEPVIDGVLTEGVSHESTAMLGPVLAGLSAWKRLGMDECLKKLGVNDSRIQSAVVSVINRLADPVSEHRLPEWVAGTALPELLDNDLLKSGKDRYYRASDTLLAHQDAITRHLRQKTAKLFSLERTICLYDLTNTYFEGTGEKNPKAKRGKSKEKRNDCPQVVVGMVLDEYGFELAHKVYEGNRKDSTTVSDMARQLKEIAGNDPEGLLAPDSSMVIMDGGLSSPDNLKSVQKAGFHYLVNDSRRGRKRYIDAFRDQEGFYEVTGRRKRATPVRIKPWTDPDTGDRLLLCKSDQRGEKEKAILSRAEERLVTDIERLSTRIEKGRLKDPVKIQRAIGRIRAKNPRSARFYTIELIEKGNETKAVIGKIKNKQDKVGDGRDKGKGKGNSKKKNKVCYRLHYQRKDEQIQMEEDLHGTYVLRTSRQDIEPERLWKLYITLTRAEDGFKMLKGNLGLRPNFHQIEHRVDAHVFITILAYQLLQTILYPLRKAGDNRNWESIRRVLETHCYTTILLPTVSGELHRIRKPGIPDERQRAIYRALGVDLKQLPVKHAVSS
ncbi:MAG: IS1634 family transposase, partial [Acidobacteria bacterium]